MSVEENKKSAYRCMEEIWNKGDYSVIPEVIAPDYFGYASYAPETVIRGHEAFEEMVKYYRQAMPDIHIGVEEVIGEGDTLAIRLSNKGTFTGKVGDTEPTGKKSDYQSLLVCRYTDGKCIESITFSDRVTVNKQLGLPIPTE